MAFHHYHHCQRKAMPMYMRQKFVPIAIDQHHWVKNMIVDIVIQWKVHHPFHRIVAHQPKIRLKQCKPLNFTTLVSFMLQFDQIEIEIDFSVRFALGFCMHRSMDSKCYKTSNVFMSPHNTHTSRSTHSTHSHDRIALSNSRKRMPGAYIKHTTPSPHEERRLQTSCSLPETPIFARGYGIYSHTIWQCIQRFFFLFLRLHTIHYFFFIVGVMYHEHHIVVHKRCQPVVVAVELHLGL